MPKMPTKSERAKPFIRRKFLSFFIFFLAFFLFCFKERREVTQAILKNPNSSVESEREKKTVYSTINELEDEGREKIFFLLILQ